MEKWLCVFVGRDGKATMAGESCGVFRFDETTSECTCVERWLVSGRRVGERAWFSKLMGCSSDLKRLAYSCPPLWGVCLMEEGLDESQCLA